MEKDNLEVGQLEMILGGLAMCHDHPAFERSMIGVANVVKQESPDVYQEMAGYFRQLLKERADEYPIDVSQFDLDKKAEAGAGICFLLSAMDMCTEGVVQLHKGAQKLKKIQQEFVEDNQ
jgi:hypothetical protein